MNPSHYLPQSDWHLIVAPTRPQPQVRILDNLDGTFCLQTCAVGGEWQTAYREADGLSRAEALHVMRLWLEGLGYCQAAEASVAAGPAAG